MPTVQYRERSDRMVPSTLGLDNRFVACATAALRSRYCTDRSPLTKIRVFVQSTAQPQQRKTCWARFSTDSR